MVSEDNESPADNVDLSPTFDPDGLSFDHIEIIEQIGSGGMGVVYKARHTLLNKVVALKILRSGKVTRDILRFQNEARTLSKLDHINVARVHDLVLADDKPYLTMDFVEGPTLEEVLNRQGHLDSREFIKVFIQVCEGLHHAHSRKVVHRDLKPGNIILSENDDGNLRVVIVDFGVAKLQEGMQGGDGYLTHTGHFVGSPLYVSPEQIDGAATTPLSDLYSLGCVMFHALVGQPPFLGDNALETCKLHRLTDPPLDLIPSNAIAVSMRDLLSKLMNKDPEKRISSAQFVKQTLLELETQLVDLAKTESSSDKAKPLDTSPPPDFFAWRAPRYAWFFLAAVSMACLVLFVTQLSRVAPAETQISTTSSDTTGSGVDDERNMVLATEEADTFAIGSTRESEVVNSDTEEGMDIREVLFQAESNFYEGQFAASAARYRLCLNRLEKERSTDRVLFGTALAGLALCAAADRPADVDGYLNRIINKHLTDYELTELVDTVCDQCRVLIEHERASNAIDLATKLHRLLKIAHSTGSATQAKLFATTGWFYLMSGKPKEALVTSENGIRILRQFGKDDSVMCINAVLVQGLAEVALNNDDAARKKLSTVLATVNGKKNTNQEDMEAWARAHLGFSSIDLRGHKIAAATEHAQKALEVARSSKLAPELVAQAQSALTAARSSSK